MEDEIAAFDDDLDNAFYDELDTALHVAESSLTTRLDESSPVASSPETFPQVRKRRVCRFSRISEDSVQDGTSDLVAWQRADSDDNDKPQAGDDAHKSQAFADQRNHSRRACSQALQDAAATEAGLEQHSHPKVRPQQPSPSAKRLPPTRVPVVPQWLNESVARASERALQSKTVESVDQSSVWENPFSGSHIAPTSLLPLQISATPSTVYKDAEPMVNEAGELVLDNRTGARLGPELTARLRPHQREGVVFMHRKLFARGVMPGQGMR